MRKNEKTESKEAQVVKTFKKDTQSRSYLLCFHNLEETAVSHATIKNVLATFPTLDYFCMADEIGAETNKLHTHVFFHTRNPIRFSTLRNKLTKINADFHIDSCKGTASENRNYVFKQDKWAKDRSKHDTALIETQEEWGELPVSHQGERTDLENLLNMVEEGYTDMQIIRKNPDTSIKNLDKIGKLRAIYLTDKYLGVRRLNLRVHYVFGQTGTGKTRNILDHYGDGNVYRVTDYQHPFDHYQQEPVILFEEFRSSLRLSDMLNYLDIYPVQLPARYHQKVACYTEVIVCSNWPFELQYSELQQDPEQQSTYAAWVRRFNGTVKVYKNDGGIIVYDTMESYLKSLLNQTPQRLSRASGPLTLLKI